MPLAFPRHSRSDAFGKNGGVRMTEIVALSLLLRSLEFLFFYRLNFLILNTFALKDIEIFNIL